MGWGLGKKMLIRLKNACQAIALYLITNPDPNNPGLGNEHLLDVLYHLNEAS